MTHFSKKGCNPFFSSFLWRGLFLLPQWLFAITHTGTTLSYIWSVRTLSTLLFNIFEGGNHIDTLYIPMQDHQQCLLLLKHNSKWLSFYPSSVREQSSFIFVCSSCTHLSTLEGQLLLKNNCLHSSCFQEAADLFLSFRKIPFLCAWFFWRTDLLSLKQLSTNVQTMKVFLCDPQVELVFFCCWFCLSICLFCLYQPSTGFCTERTIFQDCAIC